MILLQDAKIACRQKELAYSPVSANTQVQVPIKDNRAPLAAVIVGDVPLPRGKDSEEAIVPESTSVEFAVV